MTKPGDMEIWCHVRFTPTFGLRIKDLIDEANINVETIRQAIIPESPPTQFSQEPGPSVSAQKTGRKTFNKIKSNQNLHLGN